MDYENEKFKKSSINLDFYCAIIINLYMEEKS